MAGSAAVKRRIVTIPVVFLLAAVLWILAPVWFLLAGIMDVFRWITSRKPFVGTRLLAMGLVYSAGEVVGVLLLFGSWLLCGFGSHRDRLVADAFTIQLWWAELLFHATSGLMGLTYRVEGDDAVVDAPFILLSRHVSIVDTLLPAHFVSRPHRRHVRYVLKDELLVDPSIDIAGNRLPNVFIRRGSGDSESEAERAKVLAAELPDDEGLLIFPEGTRYTEGKRKRFLASLAERDPAFYDQVKELRHTLPPRPLGTLAILDGSDADVVILAHRGLEGLARIADIWRGDPIGRTVDIRFTRIPRSQIPAADADRITWLVDAWKDLDGWVADGDPNEA